jgi:hypothetical protein
MDADYSNKIIQELTRDTKCPGYKAGNKVLLLEGEGGELGPCLVPVIEKEGCNEVMGGCCFIRDTDPKTILRSTRKRLGDYVEVSKKKPV